MLLRVAVPPRKFRHLAPLALRALVRGALPQAVGHGGGLRP